MAANVPWVTHENSTPDAWNSGSKSFFNVEVTHNQLVPDGKPLVMR